MAICSSILACKMPWTEGPGRLQSMGSQRVRHNWASEYRQFSSVAQSCPTLCDPMDCSLPGSSVHGILQPGKLEWVSISFSRGSSQPRNRTQVSCVSCIDRCIPYPAAAAAKSLQSCPTLCDPIEGSPLGSSVPGILQARILEWVAISFSNAWKWKVKSESEVAQSPTKHK